jgi:hypothetical protein
MAVLWRDISRKTGYKIFNRYNESEVAEARAVLRD